jgi:hypothetical protein
MMIQDLATAAIEIRSERAGKCLSLSAEHDVRQAIAELEKRDGLKLTETDRNAIAAVIAERDERSSIAAEYIGKGAVVKRTSDGVEAVVIEGAHNSGTLKVSPMDTAPGDHEEWPCDFTNLLSARPQEPFRSQSLKPCRPSSRVQTSRSIRALSGFGLAV